MYTFNFIDAWILAAIYSAGLKGENSYAHIIASLPNIGRPLPVHSECKIAYDKFLYIGLIVADGDKTVLSAVAGKLVKDAYIENAAQWVAAIEKQLVPYKLKSMCNRFEWSEDEYFRGMRLLSESFE